MTRSVLSKLALLAFLLGAWACSRPPQEFTVLHFNDYHGQIRPLVTPKGEPCGGLARLAALTGSISARERSEGRPVFLLFAGDAMTGTATSSMFQGEPDFQGFAKMGFAAMVPGNHDWDFGAGVLEQRSRALRAPILLANARTAPGWPTFFRPARTLQAGEYRVGVIGVTRQDTPSITRPGATEGYAFEDPAEAVARALRNRGPAAWDFVVVLSHCGVEQDRKIARRNPGVGLVVGGHDHLALTSPEWESNVPIVQAGDRGRFLGVVRVTLRRGTRARVEASLLPVTADMPEDAGIRSMVLPFLDREEKELGSRIATLPSALEGPPASRQHETLLGNLITDSMRLASGADLAFVNGGSIRAGLPSGEVTGRDLLECFPFEDTLWTVRLKGSQVRALLNRCASNSGGEPWGGFLQVSGLTVVYGEDQSEEIQVDGRPLEDNAEFTVACTNFLMSGGDGHAEFAAGQGPRDWGIEVRGLVRSRLADPAVQPVQGEGRIRFVGRGAPPKPLRKAA
jgi:2',3'-cyclic-nucleotide 2'-phosphodiesterase (5'-nucleotidase family)